MAFQGRTTAAYQLGHGGQGILLIHGFCGTPAQMRFLAEGLHAAGFTVRVPLLPGHGTAVRDMKRSTFRDWHAAMRLEYTHLKSECACVCAAGHSMGGVLALLLAEEYPLDAVITLAAPMHLTGLRGLLAPFSLPASLVMPYVKWPGARRYPEDFLLSDHLSYETLPVAKVHDLYCLMRRARRNLFAVTAPILTVQSSDDPTVSSSSPGIISSGVASAVRRRMTLSHSGHLIPLGPERSDVLSGMTAFLREHFPVH